MAGEGIPGYFWEQDKSPGENITDVGARRLAAGSGNFSYRNVLIAEIDGDVAGMLLSYKLSSEEEAEDLDELPAFIRPLVELEQCVPESYYINMIATFSTFRGQGVGTTLLAQVDDLARLAGCVEISIEVFEENQGALKLYQRLGFQVIEARDVVPHSCHPYTGRIVLLTRRAA